jgi:Fic family protein
MVFRLSASLRSPVAALVTSISPSSSTSTGTMTSRRKRWQTTMLTIDVPAHEHLLEPWQQSVRGGTKDDRMMREVRVWLPPHIAGLNVAVPSGIGAEMDEALREIAALDDTHGEHLASLATLLLRAESVASSKIEHVKASLDDYARALHGIRSNTSAVSMVASTAALSDLISSVQDGEAIELAKIYRAHEILMADDLQERAYAGRPREMQNWIDGSDHSPRNATYVPPPPRTVDAYMDDLLAFANRNDIGVLLQAALAHAQFESIHPFTDGNGRIGRALINTILRRRGATHRVVVPLASAIVARRESYFDALDAYRAGDATVIVKAFARASRIAAQESRTTADRLAKMPETWRELAGKPRKGSAASKVLDSLLAQPVFSADDAVDRLGGSPSSVYAAINRLHDSGVIRPLTKRTRNQVWVASALADELDDLGVRIETRARKEKP